MSVLLATFTALWAIFATGAIAAQEPDQGAKDASAQAASDAKPPLIPTEYFARASRLSGAKLSPDGRQFAVQYEEDDKSYLVLIDAVSRKAIRKFAIPDKVELEWFRWVTNQNILFSISSPGKFFGDDVRYTRLFLLNTVQGWSDYVGRKTNVVNGDDVIHVARDGSYLLLAVQRTIYDYPSVYRVELKRDGKIKQVQRPKDGVWHWIADDKGVVRMGIGWVGRRLKVYYRASADQKLKVIAKIKEGKEEEEKLWDVARIISGTNQGYALRANDEGRVGLYLFDFEKREPIKLIYERPDADITDITIRDGKLVAAYYTDDADRVHWFDKKIAATYAKLQGALKEEEVWVTSRSRENSRMIVWAGGPADPGALYIYTPQKKSLALFTELRPALDFRHLVRQKSIQYTARDKTVIHGYLSLPKGREPKSLPLIILPHGGPYGIRDKLQYDDWVQLLANRGYAVLQPNYRGSGGYGDKFYELGAGQIGRKMQDDLDDAMDWAVKEGYADPARVCVVGGSYGGYAALWAVIRNPERYRCAASWAGVTDWKKMLAYDSRFLTRKGNKKWKARVTGEGFDLDLVSPYRLAANLSRPVLLGHGTDDSNVPLSQYKMFRKAAGRAGANLTLLEIKGEGHSFTKPENEKKWFDALVKFLKAHNPPD